jgi:hypothetical protein
LSSLKCALFKNKAKNITLVWCGNGSRFKTDYEILARIKIVQIKREDWPSEPVRIVNMEEIKCPKCGQKLINLYWSRDKIINICDNGKCPAYRNPISTFLGNKYSEKKTSIMSHQIQENIHTPIQFKSNISHHRKGPLFGRQWVSRYIGLMFSGNRIKKQDSL